MEFSNKEAISFTFFEEKNFEEYSYNLVFLLVLHYRVSVTTESDCGMDRNSKSLFCKG